MLTTAVLNRTRIAESFMVGCLDDDYGRKQEIVYDEILRSHVENYERCKAAEQLQKICGVDILSKAFLINCYRM